MNRYSLLIIGAGKIGAFYDEPGSKNVLTHAHAFRAHPGFNLLGFVDSNQQQAGVAAQIWGGEAFATIDEAFARNSVDVAVVAVPDEEHFHALLNLAVFPMKLIFTEKPLAKTISEAKQIVELCRKREIPLAINYSRRYVPEFNKLRKRIGAGELGRFLTGTGWYGKGTLHNGSHMVDLIRYLLGEVSVISTLGGIVDWRDDDPTCSALLETECGGRFIMQAVDCRCYTVFEMDLFFEHSRVRLVNSGFFFEEYNVVDSPVFSGYQVLSDGERYTTGLGVALSAAAASLHDFLAMGAPLPCKGDDGLRALQACTAIIGGFA
jgi:predicted dehydrogenase